MVRLVKTQPVRIAVSLILLFSAVLLSIGCSSGAQQTATTGNTGNQVRANNNAPVIDSLMPEWTSVERNGSGLIKCIAHDPDGDKLTYTWRVDRGSISGKGPEVTYTAPGSYVDVVVNVTVSDGMDQNMAGIQFKVVCCGAAKENPEWVP